MPYVHQPRPGEPHHFATDPTAEAMIQLFGSTPTYQGVAFTEQQHRQLMEVYGLDPDFHKKVEIEHQAECDARYERNTAEYDADVASGMPTGTILPPVRGFDSRQAAEEWARPQGRTIICEVIPTSGAVYPLPDHHRPQGLAWWCAAIDGYEVVK